MRKVKPVQSSIFTAGEELPIFTQSPYGAAVKPFVERETGGKQVAMFPVTFDELATAERKKKDRRAFALVNGFTQVQLDEQWLKAQEG